MDIIYLTVGIVFLALFAMWLFDDDDDDNDFFFP